MGLKDLVAVFFLVGCGGTWFFYRRRIAAALSKKLSRARRTKLKTIELLEERGFSIIDCDQSVAISSIIDEKSYTDTLTVDFVVQQGRERFLVKTATGGVSSRLGYRENREPLVTLAAIFSTPNILLVDPERKNIRYMKTTAKKSLMYRIYGLGKSVFIFLLGAFCAIIILYLFL